MSSGERSRRDSGRGVAVGATVKKHCKNNCNALPLWISGWSGSLFLAERRGCKGSLQDGTLAGDVTSQSRFTQRKRLIPQVAQAPTSQPDSRSRSRFALAQLQTQQRLQPPPTPPPPPVGAAGLRAGRRRRRGGRAVTTLYSFTLAVAPGGRRRVQPPSERERMEGRGEGCWFNSLLPGRVKSRRSVLLCSRAAQHSAP